MRGSPITASPLHGRRHRCRHYRHLHCHHRDCRRHPCRNSTCSTASAAAATEHNVGTMGEHSTIGTKSLMSVRHASIAWGRPSQALASGGASSARALASGGAGSARALASEGAGSARAGQTAGTKGYPIPLLKIHPRAPDLYANRLGNLQNNLVILGNNRRNW